MNLEWGANLPGADTLKAEVDAMLDAWVEVLLGHIPAQEIAGIYFKGSAHKAWHSPLDYVPELSDVDIHVLFRRHDDAGRRLGSLPEAMAIRRAVEQHYRAKIPTPVHVPRPQLTILNDLLEQPEYVPSPPKTVAVLHGEPYPCAGPSDPDILREIDRRKLLDTRDSEDLKRLPLRLVDKPGDYAAGCLRGLSWMVSPTGPRALSVLGRRFEEAWSLNRTGIVGRLTKMGQYQLADQYAAFYLAGWDWFTSAYTDDESLRAAVTAGRRAIDLGATLAEKHH